MSRLRTWFYYSLLFVMPKNYLSYCIGKLVSLRWNPRFALYINRQFAKIFSINLDEAEKPLDHYANLQEFFIRRLKPGLRPINMHSDVMVSPCDGFLSISGQLNDGKLIQAKGKNYLARDLVKDPQLAAYTEHAHYATIYLSPRDYHRFHVPLTGEIIRTIYVPGSLWPVNRWAVDNVADLFTINERMISVIKCATTGKHLMHVAVGATVVGKIELDYVQMPTSIDRSAPFIDIAHNPVAVKKGDDLGKFMFGSTIVLVAQAGLLDHFIKDEPGMMKMGEALGRLMATAQT